MSENKNSGINEIVSLVYKDLGSPAARNFGTAFGTVAEYVRTLFYPLDLKNEKARLTYEKNLKELRDKVEKISEDKIIEVTPHLGVPIMEKLSYITNEEIADLFTTLLSKAASVDTVNQAHPSFVQFIDRLSVDEARIIKYLKIKKDIPCISFNAHFKNGGYTIILEKATLLPQQIALVFPQNILSCLENLTSMGILSFTNGIFFNDESIYEPIKKACNLEAFRERLLNQREDFEKIEIDKGYFKITDFGKLFIQACNT